jgi:hypothetical protein
MDILLCNGGSTANAELPGNPNVTALSNLGRCGVLRYNLGWCGVLRHNSARYSWAPYSLVRYRLARYSLDRYSLVRYGLAHCGSLLNSSELLVLTRILVLQTFEHERVPRVQRRASRLARLFALRPCAPLRSWT